MSPIEVSCFGSFLLLLQFECHFYHLLVMLWKCCGQSNWYLTWILTISTMFSMIIKGLWCEYPFICMCFHWFVDIIASQEKFLQLLYMVTVKAGVALSQGRQQFAIYNFCFLNLKCEIGVWMWFCNAINWWLTAPFPSPSSSGFVGDLYGVCVYDINCLLWKFLCFPYTNT